MALLFEYPLRQDDRKTDLCTRKINSQQLKALQWYSRAVSRVAHSQDLSPYDEISALLTCVLFLGLEIQQGNMRQAAALVERGTELIFTYFQAPFSQHRSAESQAIAEVLVPFFSRHAVFMATLGLPLLSGWPKGGEVDEKVESQQAALQSLEFLMVKLHNLVYRGHHLIRTTVLILHDEQEKTRLGMFQKQQALLEELKQWHQTFSSAEDRQKPENAWMSANLSMYYLVTHTWVSTCLARAQSAFDAYSEAFEEIIYHASSMVPNAAVNTIHEPSSSNSGFGAGRIPPLYFTATKCRDPIIRRWALHIIRRTPKFDSIWARLPTEAILESIIAFEENTENFVAMPDSEIIPPEHRRVHHVQMLASVESIRLFTYAQGHPGNPRYLQTHDIKLNSPTKPASPERSSSAVQPSNYSHSMGDLWSNLTSSDPSPAAISSSTPSSEAVTPCQILLNGASVPGYTGFNRPF